MNLISLLLINIMNTSQKFINTMLYLFQQHMKAEELDKSSNPNTWQRSVAIGNLMLNFKEYLYQDIKELNDDNNRASFHNYIYYNMRHSSKDSYRRVEDGKLCQQEINSFGMLEFFSNEYKSIINEYLEALTNPNYMITTNTTNRCKKLMIMKYLYDVFFNWKSNPYSETITEFNNLTKKYKFEFSPFMDFLSYYSNFVNINNGEDLLVLVNGLKKYLTNSNPYFGQSKIISNNKPKEEKEEKVNLDSLKVVGLKELCLKHNLNTNKCRLRDDYIQLLKPIYG
jgi:hypothetical protein